MSAPSWLAFALVGGIAVSAAAQEVVTSTDIQRLQDSISETSADVTQLRSLDLTLASQLQSELEDARDEAAYLRVKLRRNEPVERQEYWELRDRIDNIRLRARTGEPTRAAPAAATSRDRATSSSDLPVGTEFDVRLQSSLSSATAQVEDRVEATTMVELRDGDRVIVPAGSTMRGIVRSVDKATRLDRKGSLTVIFEQITIRGRSYPIRATVAQALESEGIRGEAGRIGAGAGVGAILGAILGGGKGALAGILIGGGGVIAATEGKDVELPAGTILRVRFDSPLRLS
jgi:hypothetical protein